MELPAYSDSVFINCPFDAAYSPMLHALVFTVYACGFTPRSALEEEDSSEMRLDKIMRLIANCKFGIHDISRTEPDGVTGLPRFNMPFELGLFWGAKKFGEKQHREKVSLIFEKERYISPSPVRQYFFATFLNPGQASVSESSLRLMSDFL